MSENRTLEKPRPAMGSNPIGSPAEGQDPYPTFRDGPVPPHEATATKPTDVDLPRSRRTYAWPALIAVAIALLIGVGLLTFGGVQVATDEPPPLSPAQPSPSSGEPALPADQTGGANPTEVTPTPGPIDVPGSD